METITKKRDTMEGKDYARSNKVNLCDDNIFHELKMINMTFPSDPSSVDKTVWPEVLEWIEEPLFRVVLLLK